MFHRRLVLLLVVFAFVLIVMTLQLTRLSLVEGNQHLITAESRLRERTFLPTIRGRILDRKGRVLALDRASYDLAVNYSVITGAWEERQAARQARREIGISRWSELSPELREAAIDSRLPQWQEKTQQLWQAVCEIGGLDQARLDRRLNLIKRQIQITRAGVEHRQRQRAVEKFGLDAEDDFQPQPIREEREAQVVLPRISNEAAFAFRALSESLPGMFEVVDSQRRDQPWANVEVRLDRTNLPEPIRSHEAQLINVVGIADHIIGTLRNEVWAEDMQRRPFWLADGTEVDLGGYLVGDQVGHTGLEKVYEDTLRGLRGELRQRKDIDDQQRTDPVPGEDLQLTLDIRLQARVQAILSSEFGLTRVQQWHDGWYRDGQPKITTLPLGLPLDSAAVVMDVDSGEILAAVSLPTLAQAEMMNELNRSVHQVYINRPFEAVYPPGSIIKPLVLTAAATEGVYQLGESVTCTGHYFPNRQGIARCWIYREQYGFQTHGLLQAEEALARSCNIFFYTMADRLGMNRLSNWFKQFGLGQYLNTGLIWEDMDDAGVPILLGENTGDLPTPEIINDLRAQGQLKFSSIIMGIGQGPVTWTPVQAANAYATLARHGTVRDATILLERPAHSVHSPRDDFPLDPRLVSTALEGLRRSVEEPHGTGHHIRYADRHTEPIFNAPGVTVWAKTGTAQAPPSDLNANGIIDPHERILDHAWCVGLVGPEDERPRYAIAVVVEYGGSGGRVSGPVANQIILALQDEGYLPGGSAP